MSGGLKVGDLYASFSVKTNTKDFVLSVEKIAKSVDKVASQLKAVGAEAQKWGVAIGAGMALAVTASAQHNYAMQEQVKRIQVGYQALASSVGDMLLPAMKSLADSIGRVVNWFRSLSPEVKQHIAHFITTTATIVGVIVAMGKLGGILSAVAKSVGLVASLLGSAFAPVLIAVGVAVLAFGLLYNAWEHNAGGIRDSASSLGEHIKSALVGAAEAIAASWDLLLRGMLKVTSLIMKAAGDVAKFLGAKELGGNLQLGAALVGTDGAADALKDGIKQGVASLTAGAGTAAKALKGALEYSIQGLVDASKKMFPDFSKSSTVVQDQDKDPYQKRQTFGDPTSQKAFADNARRTRDEMDKTLVTIYGVFGRVERRFPTVLENIGTALTKFAQSLGEKLSTSSGLLSDVIQGAKSGGIGGAFTALLMSSKQFQDIIVMVNGILQRVADWLGQLIVGLEPIIAAVADLVDGALAALQPAMEIFANLLDALIAPIESLGIALRGLAPVFKAIGVVVKWVLAPILEVFAFSIKGVAIIILGIVAGIEIAWNAYIDLMIRFNRWVGLVEAADMLGDKKFDTKPTTDALAELVSGDDAAMIAKAKATAATLKLADATTKAVESMTNVPSGYKVALARFNAVVAGLGGGLADGSGAPAPGLNTGARPPGASPIGSPMPIDTTHGSTSGAPTTAPVPGGGSGVGGVGGGGRRDQNVQVHVYLDGDKVNQSVAATQTRASVRDTGSSVPAAPRYGRSEAV